MKYDEHCIYIGNEPLTISAHYIENPDHVLFKIILSYDGKEVEYSTRKRKKLNEFIPDTMLSIPDDGIIRLIDKFSRMSQKVATSYIKSLINKSALAK